MRRARRLLCNAGSTEEERFIREQEKANKAKRDENVKEITTVGVVGL